MKIEANFKSEVQFIKPKEEERVLFCFCLYKKCFS